MKNTDFLKENAPEKAPAKAPENAAQTSDGAPSLDETNAPEYAPEKAPTKAPENAAQTSGDAPSLDETNAPEKAPAKARENAAQTSGDAPSLDETNAPESAPAKARENAAQTSGDAPSLDEVRNRFYNDRFATENGAIINQVGRGYARCSMEITPNHMNAAGGVMGGAIFTLADFAFAVASNWDQGLHVSLDSHITFLGRAKGKTLIAEAKAYREGKRTGYYIIEVKDELGTKVAHVIANGMAL